MLVNNNISKLLNNIASCGATHFSRSYKPDSMECTKVHFFNDKGVEIAYYIPTELKDNNYQLNTCFHINPIAYQNKIDISLF